jgi:hypothetical protein
MPNLYIRFAAKLPASGLMTLIEQDLIQPPYHVPLRHSPVRRGTNMSPLSIGQRFVRLWLFTANAGWKHNHARSSVRLLAVASDPMPGNNAVSGVDPVPASRVF